MLLDILFRVYEIDWIRGCGREMGHLDKFAKVQILQYRLSIHDVFFDMRGENDYIDLSDVTSTRRQCWFLRMICINPRATQI